MLTQHLERCNRFISLDPVERSEFIAHYDSIRDYVISTMKRKDNLFKKIYNGYRRIMKRIFPRPVNFIEIRNHQYEIIHSVNGPANTLEIQCVSSENEKISIDFVGALEFSVKDYWMADADIPKERFLDKFWNAIPKPRKPTPKPSYSQRYPRWYSNGANRNHNKNRDWICSYAPIEKVLIHDLGFIKPLIRIFKKIRDTHDMTNLKSYYIKQIFIHQLMLNCEHEQYWERSLGELMLKMLDVIIH